MDEWDRELVHAEIERLGRAMLRLSAPPLYFDPLSQPTPGAERLGAHDDAELSHDDIRAAKSELAEQHHVGFSMVENMAGQAHQRSGLGFSLGEQVKVIAEVALTLGRGQQQVSDEQVLELSRYGQDALIGLAADVPADGAEDDAVALTRETRARRARAAEADSPEEVIRRHPEFQHLFRGSKTSGRKHPAKSGKLIGTKGRAHSSDLDDDTADRDQPGKGGKPHRRGAAQIMADNPEIFGDREAATGNVRYAPTPYKTPGRSGKPQSPR